MEEIEAYYAKCEEEGSNENQIEESKKAIYTFNGIVPDKFFGITKRSRKLSVEIRSIRNQNNRRALEILAPHKHTGKEQQIYNCFQIGRILFVFRMKRTVHR